MIGRRRLGLVVFVAALSLSGQAVAVDPDFKLFLEDFPTTPLQRVVVGINVEGTPFPALTAEGYPHAEALLAGTTWDFSAIRGSDDVVIQFAPPDDAWTCYLPEDPGENCGFAHPGVDLLLIQDGLLTGSRDAVALDDDGMGTVFVRGWSIDENSAEELRLCLWPEEGRRDAPFLSFAGVEPMPPFRRFMDALTPPWQSELFECSGATPAGVALNAPCGADGTQAILDDSSDGQGRFLGRVASAGTVTLPSGHVLDALLAEVLVSMGASITVGPFCVASGMQVRQYQLTWLVPHYGPIIQVRSGSDQGPDLTSWTVGGTTVIGYGLLPPLSMSLVSAGADSLTVSWDVGPIDRFADGHVVQYSTDPPSEWESFPPMETALIPAGTNQAVLPGLLGDTEYHVSVVAVRDYTDPISGVMTNYRSIALPTTIGADPTGDGPSADDTSYPPVLTATTTSAAVGRLGIYRGIDLTGPTPVPPLADVFTCGGLCETDGLDTDLADLRLVGEVTAGPASLSLYVHSSPITTMMLSIDGSDLVFTGG
ncbi:MAG: fibronectin type III domain-containing protein [Acidobacteriota bacterium]